MRQLLIALIAFVFLLPSVSAQTSNYWHASDIYNVELDGEGDAFVVQTVNLESLSSTTVNSFVLEIPYRNVQIVRAVQTSSSYYYDYGYPSQTSGVSFVTYSTERLSESARVTFNLATPLTANQKTTVLLFYTLPSIAKQTFQGLEFNYETTKDPNAIIRSAYASFYVPEDMELKGKPKFDIQYTPSFLTGGTFAAKSAVEYAPYLSRYYQPPSNAHFSAQNLDPGESFTAQDLYGKSVLLLYLWEIVGSIVLIIVVISILKILHVFGRIRTKFSASKGREVSGFSFTRPIAMGIVTGIAFVVSYYVITLLYSLIGSSYYYSSFSTAIAILILIFGAVIILGSLFGPAIYIGRRFGFGEGILTFLIGIGVAIAILLTISFILGNT